MLDYEDRIGEYVFQNDTLCDLSHEAKVMSPLGNDEGVQKARESLGTRAYLPFSTPTGISSP